MRRVDLTSGLVTTLVGNAALNGGPPNNKGYADGVGTATTFNRPYGVAVDGAGTFVIVVRFSKAVKGVHHFWKSKLDMLFNASSRPSTTDSAVRLW